MATFDVAKLLNKITQDIPGINTVLKALAKWDVSALTDVPDGAMQATTDTNNRLTIKKKVSDSYTPVAKLMHDVDLLDGYHASASATANTVAVRNSSGALPGNITGNAATAATAVALAAGSVVPLNQGGTEATTASQARANLGAAGSADFTAHIAKQASPTVEGHISLDALAADGSNTAAPGGFGLGKSDAGRRVTDLDTVLENCQFSFLPTASGLPSGWTAAGVGITYSHNANTKIQLIFGYLAPSELASYARTRFSTGVWGAWFILPHGITDSLTLSSSTIAASATAVKTAYNKATTATNAAAGAQSTANTAKAVTDKVTPTPTAHAVVQADADGKIGAYLTECAKVDLNNVTNNAIRFYFYARDEKPSGTSGGSTTGSTWQTRDINTVVHNNIAGASLSSHRVSLPSGRYYIRATIPVYAGNLSRAALYNKTSSAYLLYGPSVRTDYTANGFASQVVEGEITLTNDSEIELRMWVQTSYASGMGIATSISGVPEIYSEIRIWKM